MTYTEGEMPIENTTDIIDSRDVIARIAYLEEQARTCECGETITEKGGQWTHDDTDFTSCDIDDPDSPQALPYISEEELEELAALK